MTFKPATWYPIAVALSVVNLAGVAVAALPADPWHATGHAALALGFGLWAQRLRRSRRGSEFQDGLEALEIEVSTLRQELTDAQERLDFAERLLAQAPGARRVDPQP